MRVERIWEEGTSALQRLAKASMPDKSQRMISFLPQERDVPFIRKVQMQVLFYQIFILHVFFKPHLGIRTCRYSFQSSLF